MDKINEFKDYSKVLFNQTAIFFEKDVKIFVNELENTIEINQQSPGSRVFFKGGELIDTKITFKGFKLKDKNNPDLSVFPPNYPINNKTLTGCLSFIDLNLTSVVLEATNSSCEDTVNFINVEGHVKEIMIKNSFSDALDVDFSRLKIDKIITAEENLTAFRPHTKNLEKILAFEIPSSTDYRYYKKKIFNPNYFVDIKKFWKIKKKALVAYKQELKKYPNSRSLKSIEILSKFRGSQNSLECAEGFVILKQIIR